MDLPGFHLDGSALVALLALINTALTVWVARTTQATHTAVNGIQADKAAIVRSAAVIEAVAPTLTPPPTPG